MHASTTHTKMSTSLHALLRMTTPLQPSHRCRQHILRVSAQQGGGGAERSNLPVPINQPMRSTPPPPPPPPPSRRANEESTRRDVLLGAIIAVSVGVGVVAGMAPRSAAPGDEQQLEYVGSQLGVRGIPPPVSAIYDKANSKIVALLAIGRGGAKYIVRTDPKKLDRLLIKPDGKREVYALECKSDVNLENRRLMETIFRLPDWEHRMVRIE